MCSLIFTSERQLSKEQHPLSIFVSSMVDVDVVAKVGGRARIKSDQTRPAGVLDRDW